MTDWKWILSDIPISPSPETFAYFVRVLHVFWWRSFSGRGRVMEEWRVIRDVILVSSTSWQPQCIAMAGPQQLRSHRQVPGVAPLPPLLLSPSTVEWGDIRRRREMNISSARRRPPPSLPSSVTTFRQAEIIERSNINWQKERPLLVEIFNFSNSAIHRIFVYHILYLFTTKKKFFPKKFILASFWKL